jgi:hypothetical protein
MPRSYRHRWNLLITVALSLPAIADDLPSRSFGEVAAYHHVRVAQLMVAYCEKAVPAIAADLNAAYARYEAVTRRVVKQLLAEAADDAPLAKAAPAEFVSQLEAMDKAAMEAAKELDPKQICPRTVDQLESQTAESVRLRSADTIARFERLYRSREEPGR